MATILARELDDNQFTIANGEYQMSKIIQQSGGTTVADLGAGGQESIFELPPKVYNFSKSVLNYVMTPTAGTHFNLLWSDCLPEIQQIQLYTRTGLFLADLQYANNYTKCTLRHQTKISELLTNDNPITASGFWEGLHTSPVSITAAAGAGVPTFKQNLAPPVGATATISDAYAPAYCIPGADATATPVVTRKYPLSVLKDTIFSLDRDLYFGGETLYLRIVWAPAAKVYYNVTALTDADDGKAAGTAVALSSLAFFACVERNPSVENKIKNDVMSGGLNVIVPYVHSAKVNLANGSQSLQAKYNKGHGSRLLKVIWSPFPNAETTRFVFDNTNIAGSKLTDFYTMVNNERRTQFNLTVAGGEDYMVQIPRLKGSCVSSSTEFYRNYVIYDYFNNNYSMLDKPLFPAEQNYIDGLSLDTEVIYNAQITGAAQLNYYMFAVTQRNLIVNSNGMQLV